MRILDLSLRRARRAGTWALMLYAAFSLTTSGARLDEMVRAARVEIDDPWRAGALQLLHLITPGTLAACAMLVSLAAWKTRGHMVALGLVGATSAAVGASQVLKFVLPNVTAHHHDLVLGGGSFPSGHSTIAAALTLATLAVLPARARRALQVPAIALVGLFAISTVVAGWHRPSDAIAGILLALAAHHVGDALVRRHRLRARAFPTQLRFL